MLLLLGLFFSLNNIIAIKIETNKQTKTKNLSLYKI